MVFAEAFLLAHRHSLRPPNSRSSALARMLCHFPKPSDRPSIPWGMDEPDICSPIEESIDRLEQRRAAAQARRQELERDLVEAECNDADPSVAERCRVEFERLAQDEAQAVEAVRWLWRVHGFLNGSRSSVAPPKMLRALEAMSTPAAQARLNRPSTKTSRICTMIESALRQHGPLHRQRLLEILIADGVMGKEARPIDRLATILTENRHLFSSDGRGTYALAAAGHIEQRQATELAGLSGQQEHACPALPVQPGGEHSVYTRPL
ncbi:Hypothetical protein RMP42_05790 [Roseomonas mucosa]|nr:Hypothetical protein RMP42_05790 [Roseomonas mucosa]